MNFSHLTSEERAALRDKLMSGIERAKRYADAVNTPGAPAAVWDAPYAVLLEICDIHADVCAS